MGNQRKQYNLSLMYIHLVDSSNNRGQYDLFWQLPYLNHLVSYYYPSAIKEFEKVWIYLAGHPTAREDIAVGTLKQVKNHLSTYAYPKEVESKEKAMEIYLAGNKTGKSNPELFAIAQNNNTLMSYAEGEKPEQKIKLYDQASPNKSLPRVLIDSGAFTAYTCGKVIKVEDYGNWALAFRKKWEHRVKSLHFFNLDVIGDQNASEINLHKLEKMGLNPIPIFTFKADFKHLEKMLKTYNYIALGGLVGQKPKHLTAWLNSCFKYVLRHKKKTGKLTKIHLLGVTKKSVLMTYPCYSADSSGWVSCLRFGGGRGIGKDKIPRYKESKEALAVTMLNLREEIKKVEQLQEQVTTYWTQRGVKFDD